MRMLLIAIVGLALAGPAGAAVTCRDSGFGYEACVLNNGLAPPSSENVIDDDTTYTEDQRVYVRNVGCPPNWGDAHVRADNACLSPGGPTAVEVAEGGYASRIHVHDTSVFELSGGSVQWVVRTDDSSDSTLSGGWSAYVWAYDSSSITLDGEFSTSEATAYDSSTMTMNGGTVQGPLSARDSSALVMSGGTVTGALISLDSPTVTMSGGWVSQVQAAGSSSVTISGGTVYRQLSALDSAEVTINGGVLPGVGAVSTSIITIEGYDFEVDGVPVPYEDLAAETGTLTGTLASGDPVDYYFYQGEGDGAYYTGTITLVENVPEPATALLHACALFALVLLRTSGKSFNRVLPR